MPKPTQVSFYYRSKAVKQFSIERVFDAVADCLPPEIAWTKHYSRYPGANPAKCLYNGLEASRRQGDINHITGDIYYVAAFMAKRKTITTFHDLVNLRKLSGRKREVFKKFWYEVPARRSRLITCISTATKDELLATVSCDPTKIRVIADPLRVEFQPYPKPFNEEKPIALLIGSAWNKNLENQAKALIGTPYKFHLVGRPNERLVALLEEGGVEHHIESRLTDQEVLDRYQKCDVLLFASTYEGFGMPILEANAVGRPVVTSSVSSMPEVASDAACIVNPEDVDSIRSGLIRIYNDREYRSHLVERGFENIKAYHPQRIADEYLRVYREMI